MRWKPFLIILISLTLLPCSYTELKSCTDGYDNVIEDITLFDAQHPTFDIFKVFLPNMFDNGIFQYGRDNEDSLNTLEWSKYFKNKITTDSIQALLYSASLPDLNNLLLNSKAKSNKAAIEYFILLRDSTTQYKRDPDTYSWEYHPNLDSSQYLATISLCKKRFYDAGNNFLKQRYGYLTLRLLRFNCQYDECIDWYKSNLSSVHLEGTLKYRSLQYYAGALYHKEKYAEANYYFSRIFDEYPARAGQAAFDFRPNTMNDWNATIALAKNNHEKEVLYFLFGRSDPMQALKNTIAINPNSIYIPFLLKRLVNNVEDASREVYRTGPAINFSWYDENGTTYNSDSCYACIYGSSLMGKQDNTEVARQFVNETALEFSTRDKALWTAAAAYLNLLLNKNQDAYTMIQRTIALNNKTNNLDDEIKILQTIYTIKTTKIIDEKTEEVFSEIISSPAINKKHDNEYGSPINSVNAYCMQLISDTYVRQGDSLKAELCSRTNHLYYKNNTRVRLERMKDFLSKKDFTAWERYLSQSYSYNLNDILESIVTVKLYEHKFEDALKLLNKIESYNPQELYGDPFIIHIIDCHDCDFELPQKIKYTKKTFLEKMITLSNLIETDKNLKKKSEFCFEYANGLYNMSYAGNARLLSECLITNMANEDDYFIEELNLSADFRSDFWKLYNDCSEAEKWYAKALYYSSDNEFKAKCTWMIAKCQLQKFYTNTTNPITGSEVYEFDAYKTLKAAYSNTDYYKSVIKECEYFRDFALK